MKMKVISFKHWESGPCFEKKINEQLRGAIYVHTKNSVSNNGDDIIVYAFFPGDDPIITRKESWES
jgi:hypothetical protein